MEIQISRDELSKKSLMVCTPMYGGQCFGLYAKACLDLQTVCFNYGIKIKFSYLFNESLIPRARNYLTDEFLNRSDNTHMLFIDADILFDPNDVIALLALDKDVSGGPYPKKSIKWSSIKRAIERNPNIDPNILESVAGDYVFNSVKGTDKFSVTEPLEVMELGTGFMMIKREVLSSMEKEYPSYRYKPDHSGQSHFDGSRYIHAFFDTIIDSKDCILSGGSDRYLSEDYFFCRMWRKMGGQIWLCPWMKTTHIGTIGFQGNMPSVANFVGEL